MMKVDRKTRGSYLLLDMFSYGSTFGYTGPKMLNFNFQRIIHGIVKACKQLGYDYQMCFQTT